jgi:thymidylate synthase (FAD)
MTNTVELLTITGSDEDIASAAWTSSTIELTEERKGRVPALVHMLYREKHLTPFEHTFMKFRCVVDNATHVQLLKHRIGCSISCESARYRKYRDFKSHIPDDVPEELQRMLERSSTEAWENYEYVIDNCEAIGLTRARAKEVAKLFLPFSSQVEMIVSFNMRSFLHFLGLRLSSEAQLEIREVAQKMRMAVEETGNFRHSLEAFDLSNKNQV